MARPSLAALLAAGLLLGTPAAGQEPSERKAEGPRLVVEQESIDVGVVEAGADAEATFVLRNAGTRELHVLKAKPS